MAGKSTRAGTLFFKLKSVQQDAKGSWKIGIGGVKKKMIMGVDKAHGAKEELQVAYIEGVITDRGDFSIKDLQAFEGTATCELRNGKSYVLVDAFYAGEGELDPIEGEIPARFEGVECREVLA